MSVDENSLSHTKWDCKYHIVFSPKFRRKVIYGKLKADIVQILRELCEGKEVEIIEANACVDHIHMLVYRIFRKYGRRKQRGDIKVYQISAG